MSAFANNNKDPKKNCIKDMTEGVTFRKKYGCKEGQSLEKCYKRNAVTCHGDKGGKNFQAMNDDLQICKEKGIDVTTANVDCDLSKLSNFSYENNKKKYENYDERWKEAREQGDVGGMISIQTEFYTFLKSNTIKLVFAVISGFILLALMDNEEGVPSVPQEWYKNDEPFQLGGQKGGAKGWFKKTVEAVMFASATVLAYTNSAWALENQLALDTPIEQTPQNLGAVQLFNNTINTTTLRVTEAGLFNAEKANENVDKLTTTNWWYGRQIVVPNTNLDSDIIKYEPMEDYLKKSIQNVLEKAGFSQQEIDLELETVITTIKSSNDLAMKFANTAKSSLSKMGNEESRAELLKDAGAFNTNIFNYKDKTKSINIEAVKELHKSIFDVLKKHCFGSKVTQEELKRFLNPTDQTVKYTNSSDPKSDAEIHLDQQAYKLLTEAVIQKSGLIKTERSFWTKGELRISFQQILSKNLEQCVDLFYIVQQLDFLIKKGSQELDMTDPHKSIDNFVTDQFLSYSYELDHARALQNSLLNTKKNVLKKITAAAVDQLNKNIKSKVTNLGDGVGDAVTDAARKARKGAVDAAREAGDFGSELTNAFVFGWARRFINDVKKDKTAALSIVIAAYMLFTAIKNIGAPFYTAIRESRAALKEKSKQEMLQDQLNREFELKKEILAVANKMADEGKLTEAGMAVVIAQVKENQFDQNNNLLKNAPIKDGNKNKKSGFFPSLFGSKNKKKEEDEEDEEIVIQQLKDRGGGKSKKRRAKKVKKTRKKGKKKRKGKKTNKNKGKKSKKTRKKGKKKRKGKKSKKSKK